MDHCPHCNADLPAFGTLSLTCPKCGGALSDSGKIENSDRPKEELPLSNVVGSVSDSSDAGDVTQPNSPQGSLAITSDSADLRALAKPRSPSPQHEQNVRRRLAATYDLEHVSGRSMETMRYGKSVDTNKQTAALNKTWTGGEIKAQAEIRFESAYELTQEVGKGGMGRVWKARQHSLRRDVALKIPFPPESDLDEGSRRKKRNRIERQFVSEVLVTAQLDHPNIVPVYEMGKDSHGTPVLAMKLLAGKAWDQSIKTNSEEENLEILLKTCDAIAFAHAQRVVHLDLKPENIWVGEFGEVFVMDWGVAVRFQPNNEVPMAVDESEWNVESHGLPGLTPAYAAPEMLDSPPRQIGPTTDVYLLGAVLYETVTGTAPHAFTGHPMTDAMNAWRNEIVPTDKSGGLINIALKAMATQPANRYQNVRDFQEALKQYENNRESRLLTTQAKENLEHAKEYSEFNSAIASFGNALSLWPDNHEASKGARQARFAYAAAAKTRQDYDLGLSVLSDENPDEPLVKELVQLKQKRETQTRNLERSRMLLRTLLLASVASIVFFSVWIWNQNEKNIELSLKAQKSAKLAIDNQGIAELKTEEAEKARKKAEEDEQRAKAAEALATRRKVEADKAAAAAKRQSEVNAVLAQTNREIAKKAQASERTAIEKTQEALQVAYRSRLGFASETIQRNGFDVARDILKELEEQRLQSKLRHWEWGHLYSTSHDRVVEDLRTADKKLLPPVEAVAMALKPRVFVAGAEDGSLYVWNQLLQKVVVLKHGTAIHAVAVTSDGKRIVSGGVDENGGFDIRIWSTEGKPMGRLRGHRGPVLSLSFAQNDTDLLSSSADNTARLWTLSSSNAKAIYRGHQDNVRSARFSPDGNWVVTASDDRFVQVWAKDEQFVVKRFVGHDGPVYDATFTSNGGSIISGGEDRRLLRWSDLPKAGEARQFLKAHVGEVELAIEKGGQTRVPITREYEIIGRHSAPVSCVSCQRDMIFSGSHDNTVRVWNAESGSLLKTLRGHGRWVRECVGSPDGKQVLSAGYDGRVRLWDWEKHELPKVLAAAGDGRRPADRNLQALAQSADGQWIATGSKGGQLTIWSLGGEAGVTSQRLRQGHDWLATDGKLFNNGRRLLTTGGDNKAIVWDTKRATQLLQIGKGWNERGGIGWYGVASVSNSGDLIVTGSDNPSIPVRLWNAKTGASLWSQATVQAIGKQLTGAKAITFAAFSPQDRDILVGDDQGRAFLLNASSGAVTRKLIGHAKKINAGVFSPNGEHVFTASSDGTVRTWAVATGEQVGVKQHASPVTSISISRDGSLLLTGSRTQKSDALDGVIARVWQSRQDDQPIRQLTLGDLAKSHPDIRKKGVEATVRSVEFHPSSRGALITTFVRIGSSTRRYLVGDWNVEAGYKPFLPRNNSRMSLDISSASYIPEFDRRADEKVLVVGGQGARVLTRNTAMTVRTYQQSRSISSIVFSADSELLAVGSDDGSLTIWRRVGASWEPINNSHPLAHVGGVSGVLFHPRDDRKLVTAGADGVMKLWQLSDTGDNAKVVTEDRQAHRGPIRDICAATLSGAILSVSDDGQCIIWAIDEDLTVVSTIDLDEKPTCSAISANGEWVAVGVGNRVELLNAKTAAPLGELVGHSAAVNAVDFSYDGLRVITAGADATVRVWDTRDITAGRQAASFDVLLPLESHKGSVAAAQFSPTGQHIVSTGTDGQTIIWPAVAIPCSINVWVPSIDYEVRENVAPLAVTKNVQLVVPTLSNLHQATLTVELGSTDNGEAELEESLGVVLPEGFVLSEQTAQRIVIARDSNTRNPTSIGQCLAENRQWEEVLKAVTYKIEPRVDRLTPIAEFAITRDIDLKLSNTVPFTYEHESSPGFTPPITESIQVRATSSR